MTLDAFELRSSRTQYSNNDTSITFSLLETPAVSTKLRSACGVYPLLLKPDIVGILGSSQPETVLFSIRAASFLLLVTV